jgi:hypothetical protein
MDNKKLYRIMLKTRVGTYYYLIKWEVEKNLAEMVARAIDFHKRYMQEAHTEGFLKDGTYPVCLVYEEISVQEIDGIILTEEDLL